VLLLALGWLCRATPAAAVLLQQHSSAVAGSGLAGALGDALLVVDPLDGRLGALPSARCRACCGTGPRARSGSLTS
jgi:hypothetical protein